MTRPRYFIQNDTMLYAVYPHCCFYAGVQGKWIESLVGAHEGYFDRSESFAPCSLKDVRAHFNNISAHKLTTTNVITNVEQQPQVAGTQPAT